MSVQLLCRHYCRTVMDDRMTMDDRMLLTSTATPTSIHTERRSGGDKMEKKKVQAPVSLK